MIVWDGYLYADTSRTSMYPLSHVAWEVLTLLERRAVLLCSILCLAMK